MRLHGHAEIRIREIIFGNEPKAQCETSKRERSVPTGESEPQGMGKYFFR